MYFKDRVDAGRRLAEKLEDYKQKEVVVYALPRGGVVVASEIAKALHSPLDLIITRKIGHPYQPEYAIGAVCENGHSVLNEEAASEVSKDYLTSEIETQKKEARRRRKLYLSGRKPLSCKGKIAILVDDGIATGLTMKAAIIEVKHQNPKKIIVAIPVIPKQTASDLEKETDEVVSLEISGEFLGAIGSYYEDFSQVTDDQVVKLLKEKIINPEKL